MKPSPESATCHPLLSPLRHCFAVILSPGALRVNYVDGSHVSRAVTWLMRSQFLICISRDFSMEATILFCCHVVLRWYGHQEVLLQRHSSLFAYHVTSLWRPPCCFAAMLFCADTITRRRCGARSKVKITDLLQGYNCQLGLGLVTLIPSSVVNPNTNPVSSS